MTTSLVLAPFLLVLPLQAGDPPPPAAAPAPAAAAAPAAAPAAEPAAAAPAPAPAAAAPSDAGRPAYDKAYKLLHDEDDTKENLEGAIAAFEEAIKAGLPPADAAAACGWKALAYLRLGDREKDSDKKLEVYKKGQAEAERGIKLDPKCAECHYEKGTNLGRWGETRGVMKSLFILGDVKGAFRRAVQLDPNHADATLALGLVDQKVPGFAGGSGSRAEAAFRSVIKKKPTHTRAKLDLAEYLVEDDREDEALKLIEEVLAEKNPHHPGEYRKYDRARAERLKKKAGK